MPDDVPIRLIYLDRFSLAGRCTTNQRPVSTAHDIRWAAHPMSLNRATHRSRLRICWAAKGRGTAWTVRSRLTPCSPDAPTRADGVRTMSPARHAGTAGPSTCAGAAPLGRRRRGTIEAAPANDVTARAGPAIPVEECRKQIRSRPHQARYDFASQHLGGRLERGDRQKTTRPIRSADKRRRK